MQSFIVAKLNVSSSRNIAITICGPLRFRKSGLARFYWRAALLSMLANTLAFGLAWSPLRGLTVCGAGALVLAI